MATYEELRNKVKVNLPDNTQKRITPAKERQVFNDLIDKVEEVGNLTSGLGDVAAPLQYDPVTRDLSVLQASEEQAGFVSSETFAEIKSAPVKTTVLSVRGASALDASKLYAIQDFGVTTFWKVDEADTTTEDDTGSCIVCANSGQRLKNIRTGPVNILEYGAVPDYSLATHSGTDNGPAFQKAVNYLESIGGGTIVVPSGKIGIGTQVNIRNSGIRIVGESVHGKQSAPVPTSDRGSFIAPVNSIAGDIFNIGKTAAGHNTRSCGVFDISFVDDRVHSINSCIHVEASDQCSVIGCNFERIKGSGIKVSTCTKGTFHRIDMIRCGDVGKPSFDAPVIAPGVMQGCFLGDIKIEVGYSSDYMYLGTNVIRNKLIGVIFEAADTIPESQQTYLRVAGTKNQIIGTHYNKLLPESDVSKVVVSGLANIVVTPQFDGSPSGTQPEMLVSSGNNIVVAPVFALQAGVVAPRLSISGNNNNIYSASLFNGAISVTGDDNNIELDKLPDSNIDYIGGQRNNVYARYKLGSPGNYMVELDGTDNRLSVVSKNSIPAVAMVLASGTGFRLAESDMYDTPADGVEITGSGYVDLRYNGTGSPIVINGGTRLSDSASKSFTGSVIDFTLLSDLRTSILADTVFSVSGDADGDKREVQISNGDGVNPHTVTISNVSFPDGASNIIPPGGRAHISLHRVNNTIDAAITIYSA